MTIDINRAAQALYEAGQTPRPAWDQLGDATISVWRERAQRVLAQPAAFQAEYVTIVGHLNSRTVLHVPPAPKKINWGSK